MIFLYNQISYIYINYKDFLKAKKINDICLKIIEDT